MKTASTIVCAWIVLPKSNDRYFDQTTSYTSAVAPEQKKRNGTMRSAGLPSPQGACTSARARLGTSRATPMVTDAPISVYQGQNISVPTTFSHHPRVQANFGIIWIRVM